MNIYELLKTDNKDKIIEYLKNNNYSDYGINLDYDKLIELEKYKYAGYFIGLYYYIKSEYHCNKYSKYYFKKYLNLDIINKYILRVYDKKLYKYKNKYYAKKYNYRDYFKIHISTKSICSYFFIKSEFKKMIKYILEIKN